MSNLIAAADFIACLGQARYDTFFDEDGDGVADAAIVTKTAEDASAFAYSRLLQGWGDDGIVALAAGDPMVRRWIAWVGIYFRAQSKHEWRTDDGLAQYVKEYEEAKKELGDLAKARSNTQAVTTAGRSRQGKGSLTVGSPAMVIASSAANTKGPGGY